MLLHACRTGMSNRPDWPVEEGVQFYPQTNESLAQLLANHLRLKVRAYIRRSDYRETWGSFEQRRMGDLCGLSGNAAPGEEWCKRWVMLAEERKEADDGLQIHLSGNGRHESGDFRRLSDPSTRRAS